MSRTFAPPAHRPAEARKAATPAPAQGPGAVAVGPAADAAEREADAAARQVLRSAPGAAPPRIQRHPAPVSGEPASDEAAALEGGHPLDASARRYFEPRFRHDFARVRVHTDARAAASARALGAGAYAVGAHIAFASGRYAPETPAGRRLLAHELAHVAQASPWDAPVVRRQPATAADDGDEEARKAQEVEEYRKHLVQRQDTEEMPLSREKALVLARKRLRGEAVALPPNGDALLVLELLYGGPLAEHRAAALRLMEEMDPAVLEGMVSREAEPGRGKMNLWKLSARFEGPQLFEVVDILSRRLHGGFTELLKGTDPLRKATDAELEKHTAEWLDKERKSAEAYFAEAWGAHRVVSLGETHHVADQQRRFAADMVKRHGGTGVTLALELKSQAAVDAYVQRGDKSQLPGWVFEHQTDKMLDAARANGTRVVAADVATPDPLDPARDAHMAAAVGAGQARSQKVLYYGGALHVREWRAHHDNPMGRRLADASGEESYAIVLKFDDGDAEKNPLFEQLRQRFPSDATIGFDVDRSPMKWHRDPGVTRFNVTVGKNIDGYIFFLK